MSPKLKTSEIVTGKLFLLFLQKQWKFLVFIMLLLFIYMAWNRQYAVTMKALVKIDKEIAFQQAIYKDYLNRVLDAQRRESIKSKLFEFNSNLVAGDTPPQWIKGEEQR